MKKIKLLLFSIIPLFLIFMLYFMNSDSIVKWNVIGYIYTALLLIVYIRAYLLYKKHHQVLELYKNHKYNEIIEFNHKPSGLTKNLYLSQTLDIVIALSYWNVDKNQEFHNIISNIQVKQLQIYKYFYLFIYYYENENTNDCEEYIKLYNQVICDYIHDKKYLVFTNIINFVSGESNPEAEDVLSGITNNILLNNDVKTQKIVDRILVKK